MSRDKTEQAAQGPHLRLVELGPGDVDRMLPVERRSFIPALRADGDTIRRRFDMGHIMLGIENADDGLLVGMGCFSHAWLEPGGLERLEGFPVDEHEFCNWPVPDRPNITFAYNLAVLPEHRSFATARRLARAMLARMKRDGIPRGMNCIRLVTYNGTGEDEPEATPARPELRAAVDGYLADGIFPPLANLEIDPLVRLERRLLGCDYRWILPHFAPWDPASGGHRLLGIFEAPGQPAGGSAR